MSFVSKIAAFCPLSKEAQAFLTAHTKTFQFKKGELVLEAGKPCEYLYSISKGMMRGYYFNESKEITNWIANEDDFSTSFYSFISKENSYETIEALENTTTEALSRKDLESLYTNFPETEQAGRLVLENYYLRLEERVIYIQFKTAKERYEHFYETRRDILKRAPLGCIASYLGITQETLSRIRAEK